jgi:hypothetical protein
MGSLPLAHAGVGSAVNDTTRLVGGALGVAVLGSLLATGYRDHMDAVAGLPDAASGGIAETVGVATHVGGAAGAAIIDAGQSAFVQAMSTASIMAAAVAAAGALIAFRFLPARAAKREATVEPARAEAVTA